MKILILTDELSPHHIGGAGVVAKQICNELSENGLTYDLFCSRPIVLNCFYQKLYAVLWPFFYFKMFILLMKEKYNHIIVNDLRSAYFCGLFLSKKSLSKCIYIVHGTEAEIVYSHRSYKNEILLLHVFYTTFLRLTKKIVFVSKFTFENFVNKLGDCIEINNKSEISYAGLDAEYFRTVNLIENEKHNNQNEISGNKVKLVSFSRIEPRKGYYDMYSIFKSLLVGGVDVTWHIYGGGSLLSEFKEKVNDDNLSNYISFFGPKDRLEIARIIIEYDYDIFWLLPNKPEAFGLTYIESAALGLPCIGPKLYGIQEAISCEESGFFYSDHHAMIEDIFKVKCNKPYYKKKCKEWALNFQSSSFVSSLLN